MRGLRWIVLACACLLAIVAAWVILRANHAAPTATSTPLITQFVLESRSRQGQFNGLTLDQLSREHGGYPFKEHALHRGLYTTYVEHLGGAVGVFTLEAQVSADGTVVQTTVKYD